MKKSNLPRNTEEATILAWRGYLAHEGTFVELLRQIMRRMGRG